MNGCKRRDQFGRLVLIHCLLLFSLLTTGCGSAGKLTMREPFSVKLGQYKTATVEVKSALRESPEKLDEFMVQLESRIIAKLRGRNVFEKVYAAVATDTESDLEIVVTIMKVRDVNNYDRVMWGALAGQANTQAMVEVRQRATGKILGSGDIEGKSSGGSVFAGTTQQAVDRVADEVVRLIAENL